MTHTMRTRIRRARDGSDNARQEISHRLQSLLVQCLDNEISSSDGQNRLPISSIINEVGRQLLERNSNWEDKIYFYSLAAKQMRIALRDFTGFLPVNISNYPGSEKLMDFSLWEHCLEALSRRDEKLATMLELYYVGGMSYEGIASSMSMSISDVDREIRFARSWVCRELHAISAKELDDRQETAESLPPDTDFATI